MPFIDLEPQPLGALLETPKGAFVTPGSDDVELGSDAPAAPGWSDTFKAGWRQDNTIASQLTRSDLNAPTYKEDGFDPWTEIKGTQLEQNWESFADIHNRKAFDMRRAQLEQEDTDKRTLAAAPWYKAVPASISAAVLDWPTLLPGGTVVRSAKGGLSIARTAASVGVASAVSAAAQEAALQAEQQTRPLEESVVGIGSSAIVGALIGPALAKGLDHIAWRKAIEAHDRFLAGEAPAARTAAAMPESVAMRAAPDEVAQDFKIQEEAPVPGETGRAPEPAPVAAEGEGNLPPVAEGYVRFYHGGDNPTSGGGRWVAQNFEYAKNYRPGHQVSYIDLPESSSLLKKSFDDTGTSQKAPYVHFELPEDLAKQLQPVPSAAKEGDAAAVPESVAPEIYDTAARLMAHEDIDPELAIALAAQTNFNAAPASVGAAASVPASLEGNAIAGKVAATLANLSRFPTKGGSTHWNPLLRVLHSPSSKVRELGLGMAENPIYLRKNMEGVATKPAAETLMKEWQGGLADATRANRAAFNEFRKSGGKMTRAEFNEAVADAMRNNDLSNNPHVQAAAQAWRAKVVDPLKNAAINARLLPEDVHVDTAASYFTRWWNRNKLISKEPEFKRITRGWVEGMMPRWQADFDKETTEAATTMGGKKRADYLSKREAEFEERFGMFPGEVSAGIADDVFNTLTGRIEGADLRPELIKVQARGPLKERTFSIPDRLVRDFLENDVERVMDRYTRTMGADVEIATKFGHLDFPKLEAEINADYQKMSGSAKTEKQRMAIDVARQNDIADIKGIWDLLRGTGSRFAHPWEQDFEHISRMVRMFNYIRLMGESSLASLAETVRPAMVHGLMPYMKTVGSLATNLEGVKLSAKEAQLAGQISEGVLGHRMALMTEISDPYSSTGKAETLMRHMSDVGSKWNGIRLLTDAQKTIASVMTQNRILDNASKYTSVAGKEKAYMAYLGIDERMAERITEQFRAHGKLVDGVRVAGTEKWTDAKAKRTYRAAINKDVDSIITTPGVADVPLFVNTPTGAAMMQFRRFALAAHQRVLLRGLQEDQTRFIGGLIAMTALGMFTTWLKAYSANRDEKLSDFSKKPGWWVGEGIDRSGILAGTMEVSNAFEKMTGFNPIKTPMQAFDRGEARTSQKLQNRNEIGTVFGPSAGLVEDVMSAGKIPFIVAKGERPTKGQKNAAERLLPFNSYPVVRQFLRYVANPQ